MKVSIRDSKLGNLASLSVYRPRERAWSLPGSAHETRSGYWIVHIPGHVADVVKDKAAAFAALKAHYDAKETPY